MGAFAFSCPLSLYTVCFFCTVAQLLGLVFPSLPVFASGGWGVNVGLHLLRGWSIPSEVPQPASRPVECWVCLVKFMESVCVCVWEHIFILAWLIRMPLAGSCPNRGCHLIKSIICWLNLLELRRKRSVHTLSRPVCLFCPSLTHSFTHLYSEVEKEPTENPWLIQANHQGPPNHISLMRWPVWQNWMQEWSSHILFITCIVVVFSQAAGFKHFHWGFTNVHPGKFDQFSRWIADTQWTTAESS